MKFKNKSVLLAKGRDTIRVRIRRKMQTIIDILYIFEIRGNLLFIIALDKRDYKVRFNNIDIKIIN